MADTFFIDGVTKVSAAWLNDVNDYVYQEKFLEEISGVIAEVTAFFQQEITDYRGETYPNYMRRVIEYRRPIGGGDINDIVAEKTINTTAAGYCLRYFAGASERFDSLAQEYAPYIEVLSNLLVAFQYEDERTARYGGFATTTGNGSASAYNAGMVGLGLLSAYRVTNNPQLLVAAKRTAVFLQTLHSPNSVYTALYGQTPLPSTTKNNAFKGFCDSIGSTDVITTTHTTWNLLATKFLKELYEITGDSAHRTLYEETMDWGATGVTGFWDFWTAEQTYPLTSKVSANWFGTGLIVSDGEWHRRGEGVISGGAVHSGTAVAASATTVTLAAGASPINDFYNGMSIRMTSGAASGKGSIITDYDGSTKVATLQFQFPSLPAGGDTYQIGLTANTIGSDQMEYGIESLYDTGYSVTALRTAYETINSWPNADAGAFGAAYDPRLCWTGYFRPYAGVYGGQSKAFGTQYDVQGIGPLLKFKKEQYPEHYTLSLAKAKIIPDVATLVDENWNTVWSTDSSGQFEYTTVGTGTVKGAVALGIVESV